jgi:hypothetical protein
MIDPELTVQHNQSISFQDGWLNLTEGDFRFAEDAVTGLWDARTKNDPGQTSGNTWQYTSGNQSHLTKWLNLTSVSTSLDYLNRGESITFTGTRVENPFDAEQYTKRDLKLRLEANGDTESFTHLVTTDSNGGFDTTDTIPDDAIDTYDASSPSSGETLDYAINLTSDGNVLNQTQEKQNKFDVDRHFYLDSYRQFDATLNRNDTQRVNATFHNVRDETVLDGTTATIYFRNPDGDDIHTLNRTTTNGITANFDQQLGNDDKNGSWRYGFEINNGTSAYPENDGNVYVRTNESGFTLFKNITIRSIDIDLQNAETTPYFNRDETVTVTGTLGTGNDDALYRVRHPDGDVNRTIKVELFHDAHGTGSVVSDTATVHKTNGSFEVDITLPSDSTLDDTYSSLSAGKLESKQYDIQVFDNGSSVSATNDKANRQDAFDEFDVDANYYPLLNTEFLNYNRGEELNYTYRMHGVREQDIDGISVDSDLVAADDTLRDVASATTNGTGHA